MLSNLCKKCIPMHRCNSGLSWSQMKNKVRSEAVINYRFANNDRILWTGRWRITDVENEIRTTGVWTASQLFEDDLRSAGYTLGILVRLYFVLFQIY